MFAQAINAETKRVLEKIGKSEITSDFYLAGGTALAIHLGHRESIDLDWFSSQEFSNARIKEILAQLGNFSLVGEEEGTIHGLVDNVKVSFFHYPYRNLFALVPFEGVQLADERDIAAMKIDAISSRASKKDFIDLYYLFKKYSLEQLLEFFEEKYSNIQYNKLHILKSLAYFETAENEPMPHCLETIQWEEVKKEIAKKANDFLK